MHWAVLQMKKPKDTTITLYWSVVLSLLLTLPPIVLLLLVF